MKFGRGEKTQYVIWHSKLNQIMVGMENGTLHIFYDNNNSDFGGAFAERDYVHMQVFSLFIEKTESTWYTMSKWNGVQNN